MIMTLPMLMMMTGPKMTKMTVETMMKICKVKVIKFYH